MNKPANTTALAFMGDAVYEVYIRKHVMESGQQNADRLHRMAVGYVRAEAQAKALKKIYDALSGDEQELVKRARNRKSTSRPQNADPVAYKLATAFEALVGHLYITGNPERMEEIIRLAVAAIEDADVTGRF